MTLQNYLTKLNTLYITGNAREHSYRGDLQNLLHELLPGVLVTNEPARVACGAPDYVLTRKDVPVGYVEAKDISVDLTSKSLKEQFDRYRNGLPNIVFTNYLDFHFYKDGELTAKISIGHLADGKVVAEPENFEQFTILIKNFSETIAQTIKSPTRLAEMMAGRARYMADIIEKSLNSDDKEGIRSNLKQQMLSFQDMLIHDIDNKAFADIYAQTIAYGMFAARYHDPTLPTFSREEAATLIPKSNPFLRKLFQDIAGYDLDNRLLLPVDELVRIFLATDVAKIMKNFGKSTKQEDPVVHFYETFLASYSPALRKARGVWYTPQPVVNFIVRAVDDILKTEFGLKDGLADTSKTKIKVKAPKLDERSKAKSKVIGEHFVEQEVHKVQILDPATGTGTFLAEVVRHIYKKFEGQQGMWSKYVSKDLIPRLNGFELLMASYAMAHLKMDMLLTETGYKPTDDQRFKIFLTNSLEEHHKDTGTIFSNWLADEANQANAIKRDAPVMVVIGNPPYSVSSTNKSAWIEGLVADYKKDLKERNIQPLSDDYIKFIRFGQHFIDKNGEGILAYISNNSFIDGIIHRQMRKHLLESFDKIYILDLHGNAKKKEVAPDGSPDQNVFDIMQGVSINILVKSKQSKSNIQQVYTYDLQGKRNYKYQALSDSSFYKLNWSKLSITEPNFFYVNKNFNDINQYETGFKIDKLFQFNSSGIKTHRDNLVIDFSTEELQKKISLFNNISYSDEQIKSLLCIKDNRDWSISESRRKFIYNERNFNKICYRPFDFRILYYDTKLIDFAKEKLFSGFINGNQNVGLICARQFGGGKHFINFISNQIVEISSQPFAPYQVFPLYLYPDNNGQLTTDGAPQRVPNLNPDIVKQIAEGLGLQFVPEKEHTPNPSQEGNSNSHAEPVGARTTFAPIDLLDYIYAVLHSPSYREKYKEFLKIDFPRVPYPTDADVFWQLVKLGGELRQIHLLESPVVEQYITKYPEDGDNVVDKPRFEHTPNPSQEGNSHSHAEPVEARSSISTAGEISEEGNGASEPQSEGRVYVNSVQYFEGVPQVAWNFYIGGYQPAQKWLKDRKGRELSYEDIFHYQKIIVALTETDRLMKEIDKVITL
jgi:predicted helicase